MAVEQRQYTRARETVEPLRDPRVVSLTYSPWIGVAGSHPQSPPFMRGKDSVIPTPQPPPHFLTTATHQLTISISRQRSTLSSLARSTRPVGAGAVRVSRTKPPNRRTMDSRQRVAAATEFSESSWGRASVFVACLKHFVALSLGLEVVAYIQLRWYKCFRLFKRREGKSPLEWGGKLAWDDALRSMMECWKQGLQEI